VARLFTQPRHRLQIAPSDATMNGMALLLRAGDRFDMKGRTITVTQMQADVGNA
jgi:hypothetical protein